MNDRRLVYSSDQGRVTEPNIGLSNRRPPQKKGSPSSPQLPDDGVVRLFREKGGRGGKTVTVVRGLPAADLDKRVSELKRLCGAGGTVRDGAIEIQGDHRDRIAERLQAMGYKVKLAGG
jgi:translation initiation factor 1